MSNAVIEQCFSTILTELGEDAQREGLAQTPHRFAKMMREVTTKKEFEFTVFETEGYDEIVIVRNIPFYSLCEHHCLPFFGSATVAYLPDKHIVGLSKLPRTVKYFSTGLQNQERITQKVAEYVLEKLKPRGVAVLLQARHMCMEMRGVSTPGAETITSVMRGIFRDDAKARAEVLRLVNG